jgi:hypothetical protein
LFETTAYFIVLNTLFLRFMGYIIRHDIGSTLYWRS